MNRGTETYHIFLSYAHAADGAKQVRALIKEMRTAFRNRTGTDLQIFVDTSEIRTADIWSDRITDALESSSVLVPVIDGAYYRSEWCRREWDYFTALERDPSNNRDVRRIFPVMLAGQPDIADLQAATQRWIRDVNVRQSIDLAGGLVSDRRRMIGRLVKDIIASLDELPESRSIPRAAPVERLDAVTGWLNDHQRFVGLLAQAVKVTIVGQTNERLASALEEALGRKRELLGDPAAFWSSLRIVFLSDTLLDAINDERAKVPIRKEAVEERRRAALIGRRTVGNALDRVSSSSWSLYESPYYLPFVGTLFEMPDRVKVVQLVIRRPQRLAPEHIYMEFEDRPDEYFAGAFDDIVGFSTSDQGIIPVGVPEDHDEFRCTSWRYRHTVLTDGREESERTRWLPVVLAVTWTLRGDKPSPLLQLRTLKNSHRELDRVSHLSSYIYDRDVNLPDTSSERLQTDFRLPAGVPAAAVRRRIERDAHVALRVAPDFVTTGRYLSPYNRENLFFYIFIAEFPSDFSSSYEDMRPFTVEQLLAIRTSQALRNAQHLCAICHAGQKLPADAIKIAASNLALHTDDEEFVNDFRVACRGGAALDRFMPRLETAERQARQHLAAGSERIQVLGLAGFQYREFYTTLLPRYAAIGVPGAREALEAVSADKSKAQARDRLSRLYSDSHVMDSVPGEI